VKHDIGVTTPLALARQPHKQTGNPRYALTAKVSTAEAEPINAAAEAAGVTRSAWIAEALHRVLTRPDVGVIAAPSTSSAGPVRVTVEASQAA